MVMTEIEAEQLICDSQRLFSTPAAMGEDLANDRYDYDEEDDEDLW